jgi:hypothetical protein
MAGTTFAMSWCVSQRRCAVAEHDLSKTITQIIKTRAKVPALCAKAVHWNHFGGSGEPQLGAWIVCANCFGAF